MCVSSFGSHARFLVVCLISYTVVVCQPSATLPSPSIKALVEIPGLSVPANVEFLVDTGAARTTLHPGDLAKLGIDIVFYATSVQPLTFVGVGGEASYGEQDATLHFKNTQIHLPALIGPLDKSQVDIALKKQVPSLLGRDLLNLGLLIVDYETNQVSIEMYPVDQVNQTKLLRSKLSQKSFFATVRKSKNKVLDRVGRGVLIPLREAQVDSVSPALPKAKHG